ncbi:hypothetical protein [Streptomyces sp. WMMC897]|uniref:hypothetical protein n=1 Tax=Streptomyces sp. WMMC897 TaxID=3014782 RepID=UPI0022B67FCE|nr:hypothetical protein [Streptomyces sp. WMMC897]MCZ7414453.1 hypothetical protein [Streptomyces sp. WMMC897]
MTVIDVTMGRPVRESAHAPLSTSGSVGGRPTGGRSAGERSAGVEEAPCVAALLAGEDEDGDAEPHIWRGID